MHPLNHRARLEAAPEVDLRSPIHLGGGREWLDCAD
jgi:hypothetical protein